MRLSELQHERTIGSKGRGLWGMKGTSLPAYIEHIYNDIVEGGHPPGSTAYRLAVGICRNFSQGHDGKGNKVSAATVAKAKAAMAEWDRLRAKAKADNVREAAVFEPVEPRRRDLMVIRQRATARVEAVVEGLEGVGAAVRLLRRRDLVEGEEASAVAEALVMDLTLLDGTDGPMVFARPPVARLLEVLREDWSDAARKAAALKRRLASREGGLPTVSEIRALPDDHREDFMKAVSFHVDQATWGDNRRFRQMDAYHKRLKKAGLSPPARGAHPPPAGFQD